MANRLITFSITFADDNGNVSTVNNIDGNQISNYAALFNQPIVVSASKYNKLQNKGTRSVIEGGSSTFPSP